MLTRFTKLSACGLHRLNQHTTMGYCSYHLRSSTGSWKMQFMGKLESPFSRKNWQPIKPERSESSPRCFPLRASAQRVECEIWHRVWSKGAPSVNILVLCVWVCMWHVALRTFRWDIGFLCYTSQIPLSATHSPDMKGAISHSYKVHGFPVCISHLLCMRWWECLTYLYLLSKASHRGPIASVTAVPICQIQLWLTLTHSQYGHVAKKIEDSPTADA